MPFSRAALRRSSFFGLLLGLAASLVVAGCGGSSSANASSGGGGGGGTQSTPAVTTTTLAVSPNPAAPGTTVVLTAAVTSSMTTPTGTVTFLDGTTSLGSVALTNGAAALTVSSFAAGSAHTLSASYGGGSAFAASTSAGVALNITTTPPPALINAHVTLDFTTPHQTIAGFGGSEAFYLSYLTAHPYAAEIYKALFDPAAGLGLTFLRVQDNYNQFTGSNATTFDTDTPAVVKAANAAHGTPLTLLMSSWSPPASLKSNGSVNNGGTLATVNGGYNYAGFAQYWYDSLNAYAALGVSPAYISIQNEPDFTATYASCRFNPSEAPYNGTSYAGYGLAFDAVYKKLQTLASPPKMAGPETFSVVNFIDTAAAIPANEVAAYAHHLYNVSATNGNPDSALASLQTMAAAYPTALKFQTEYYAQPAINDAWDIHNALAVGNDNAYFYWGLAWPSGAGNLSNGQATDQQGVLYIDNPFSPGTWAFAHGWTYNDAYYALKHFSFYVRPGYVRYDAAVDNTDERVSVYQSPDKKTTVIVAMNLSASASDGMVVNLGGVAYASSTIYRSTFTTPQATGERWANLGAYTTSGISLPPQSVVTVVLTN